MENIDKVLQKLSNSKFRSSFHLNKKMKEYVINNGYEKVKVHAEEILRKRIQQANPKNDGKQTPMKQVHPVFIAQHATATCCRGCLNKWYGIEKNRELTDHEIDFCVALIMAWIEKEYNK
jgi:hypothetical protein